MNGNRRWGLSQQRDGIFPSSIHSPWVCPTRFVERCSGPDAVLGSGARVTNVKSLPAHSLLSRAAFPNWGTRESSTENELSPLQYSCLEIPWTEEPGGLQSMGSQRVGHDWATSLSLSICQINKCIYIEKRKKERKWTVFSILPKM